ncbi:retroviral-like aspartic protease family protein [Brachyspira catarrhinii]|uniref:Peptidase A2 domain-containing protein n=1 Tax=Brachyspira catarrhinii TaxID=2528966 RepID=A0ABY2TS17_9SPIR|nr:retroviral-like aspartic protease family protein [Brachyspira catarrhinii]TKZ35662.1 hypothetical protein EZH24_04055 [Brachyspira catarrhinii]
MANKKIPHFAFSIQYKGIARELVSESEIVNPLNSQRKKYKAIWDTGATNTVITPKVLNELSLTIVDTTTIIGVNSKTEDIEVALFNLLLPNNVSIKEVRGSVCTIGGDSDILIGMDIIKFGDFAISNGGGQTLFSFAIPPFENKTDLLEKANKTNKNNKLTK